MLKSIIILFIKFYQVYLSPRKKYCCAFSHLHGKNSCSTWGLNAIEKHGVAIFIVLMVRRLIKCRSAYESMKDSEDEDEDHSNDIPATAAQCCAIPAPCFFSFL